LGEQKAAGELDGWAAGIDRRAAEWRSMAGEKRLALLLDTGLVNGPVEMGGSHFGIRLEIMANDKPPGACCVYDTVGSTPRQLAAGTD
jgi:hypothetical protein